MEKEHMTDEELCLLIQQGHDELIPELWEQCKGFIYTMAGKYVEGFRQLDESAKEDCVQEAFFSLIDAVHLYKPQEASFIYYLSFHLRNAFTTACFGGRGKKRLADPLNHAVSLDSPLSADGEELVLCDLVAEKEQGQQTDYAIQPELEAFINEDYWKSVNRFMHQAFDESSDDTGKQIYKYMLDHDCGFRDAIKELYGEEALLDGDLMNRLRSSKRKTQNDFQKYWQSKKGCDERRRLDLDDAIFRNGLRSYGLKRFRSAGSFVEAIVIGNMDGDSV